MFSTLLCSGTMLIDIINNVLFILLLFLEIGTFHRNYSRKYDMDEPPKLEEPLDESDSRVKRLKEQDVATNRDDYNLEERFYRYGVRPEWLVVHRVINHRLSRDGRATYLVKWRELGYDQATWEDEHEDIPGLKQAIEYYLDLRAANCCDGSSSRKGKKGEKSRLICFSFISQTSLKIDRELTSYIV